MGFPSRRQAFATATGVALMTFAFASARAAVAADVCEALWRARNAIFANKGYCFESPEGQAAFGKSCFPPYGKLTPAEEADVQRIKDVEAHQRCAPTPSGINAAATATGASGFRVVPKYVVQLALSRAAANKLSQSGETVRIAAFYYGTATRPSVENESGEIALANEAVDLPSGTTAANLGGISISEAEIGKTSEGQPLLLINVYTSRKVFPDNLFDCGIYQGPAAQAGQVNINCKLIGE
ncbi:MAG: YARHG domain-containing protein [Proteobacteria bacterium]|nr:YARHG domain-containing protein [Pseudomonadota bacterium]